MMKNRILAAIAAILAMASTSASLQAIEFDEVRNFDDVFVISASAPARDRIEVRWDIEEGFYLYNNKFLGFKSGTEGVVLGEPEIPPGKRGFDDLLGEEVEKYYHELVVSIPLVSVAPGVETVELRVRSQGCMEDELCYPPSAQKVAVTLPPAGQGGWMLRSAALRNRIH